MSLTRRPWFGFVFLAALSYAQPEPPGSPPPSLSPPPGSDDAGGGAANDDSSTTATVLTDMPLVRATSESSRSEAMTWSATMRVQASFVDNGDVSFWSRLYCYEGSCSYPGPTIEVVPGDHVTLTIINELGSNPAGEDTTMNSMHSPNTTNLHTHGLHIDPRIDTVFEHAQPGESLVYEYDFPLNHAPGLYWYHDHTHGGSALRVMGGLAGAFIVRPSGNENLPTSLTASKEYVLVLTPMNAGQELDTDGFVSQACSNGATCDPDTQPPGCTQENYASSTTFSPFRQYSYEELSAATGSSMDPTVILSNLGELKTSGDWTYYENEMWTTFTNGRFEPYVSVNANEVVTLRIVYAGGGVELELSFTGDCEAQVIAWDGIYLNQTQVKTTSSSAFLMAGARVDIQMSCASGDGVLQAKSQYSVEDILTLKTTSGGGDDFSTDFTTSAELREIIRPYYLYDLTSDYIEADVYYSSHVSQGSRPTSECGGSNMFWWGAGTDCSAVAPWGSDQPSSTSSDCPFGFFQGERGEDISTFQAANKLVTYIGDGSTDGEVNEWSLYGLGKAKHPLHLHVHHMQIVGFECVDGSSECDQATMEEWIQIGEWRDVFPTFEGVVKTRFRATDFPGETVLHCHFLRHEDLGMMDTVLVVDGYRNPPTLEPTTPNSGTSTSQPSMEPTPMPVVAVASTPQPSINTVVSDDDNDVLAPVPTPSPTAQDDGYCYAGSSTVLKRLPEPQLESSTLRSLAPSPSIKELMTRGLIAPVPISEIKIRDEIVGLTKQGLKVLTQVQHIPKSRTSQPIVEVTLIPMYARTLKPRSTLSHKSKDKVRVTFHHTFPTCAKRAEAEDSSTHATEEVEASKLSVGDCLLTMEGRKLVQAIVLIYPQEASVEDEYTYSIYVDNRNEKISSIAVNNVFTHVPLISRSVAARDISPSHHHDHQSSSSVSSRSTHSIEKRQQSRRTHRSAVVSASAESSTSTTSPKQLRGWDQPIRGESASISHIKSWVNSRHSKPSDILEE